MKCRNCNAELEPDARFCEVCGTPTFTEPIRTTYKPSQINDGKRKPSARNIAVGVITIALIIAAVCATAMALNMRGLTSSAESSESAEAVSSSSSSAAAEEDEVSSSASSEESEEESSSSASAVPTFDNVAAEEQARKDAIAAGMQVFSGTLRITTYANRADEINPKYVNSVWEVADDELALVVFTIPETVSAYGSQGAIETKNGQEALSLTNPDKWRDFDGQIVTVAAFPDDLVFSSGLTSALYSAAGGAVLIAPLTETRAAELEYVRQGGPDPLPELRWPEKESKSSKSSEKKESRSSAEQSSGDYILPDSSTHRYTTSELSKLSDYDLFIARNEIYARYGRKFQSSELQSYFESKSWYHGTVSAADFDESVLNDTELANTATILALEQSRGSKYL